MEVCFTHITYTDNTSLYSFLHMYIIHDQSFLNTFYMSTHSYYEPKPLSLNNEHSVYTLVAVKGIEYLKVYNHNS